MQAEKAGEQSNGNDDARSAVVAVGSAQDEHPRHEAIIKFGEQVSAGCGRQSA